MYNQLLLDEDSRQYVTVNTHKGLYQYTRLPFGIASAHRSVHDTIMDTILQGVDGVACYIDDIIITGKSSSEHLEHLEEVLRRLLRHGVHVKRQNSFSRVCPSLDIGLTPMAFTPSMTSWRQ